VAAASLLTVDCLFFVHDNSVCSIASDTRMERYSLLPFLILRYCNLAFVILVSLFMIFLLYNSNSAEAMQLMREGDHWQLFIPSGTTSL
jgi:hypothetical protein